MEKEVNQNLYRGYNLGSDPNFPSMVKVSAKGRGTIPNVLKGLFTTRTAARIAVDSYHGNLKKGKKDDKTKDTSSD